MMSETYYSSVKGETVKNALTELRPVLDKLSIETAVVTAISAAIIIQYPRISADHLLDGVAGASKWIASYLEAIEGETGPLPKEKVN